MIPFAGQLSILFGLILIITFIVLMYDIRKHNKKMQAIRDKANRAPVAYIDDYEYMLPYLHDTQIENNSND